MASKAEATANSEQLATIRADGESLSRDGHSESAANLSRATPHAIMKILSSLQQGITQIAMHTTQTLPASIEADILKCVQVLDSANLIAYKQEKRDAGGFDTSQELIC